MRACCCINCRLQQWTDEIIAYRIFRQGNMEMSRLSEKLKLAGGVVSRVSTKIEARADALIAREPEIEARTDEVFNPHEAIIGDAEKGLDDLEAALRLMSNGAPLELSSDSPASPPPVPEVAPASRPQGS